MDQTPKENQSQIAGNIFDNNQSGGESSAYEQTQNIESIQPLQQPPPAERNQSNLTGEGTISGYNQPGNENLPPPPYTEDKRKKYIFIGIGAIFLIFLLLGGILLLRGKGAVKAPVNKDVVLTYWGLWEDKDIMQPLIDEYKTKHPNITINYTIQEPKLYRERLQAAIGRGEGPDIFRFHNSWVPMIQSVLAPMPDTIYSPDEFAKIFFPVANTDLKVGSKLYGIPLEIDGLMLLYNDDILKSANITVPATWDDVKAAVSKLTVKEAGRIKTSAIALGTAENIEHFSDIIGLMMLQNGVNLSRSAFSCNEVGKTNCATDVLAFYRSFADPPGNAWDETQDNSLVAFAGGNVAMIFAPSWELFFIKSLSPDLNFKTAPVPQLPCKSQPCPSINWATYWVEGVSATSKYQTEAWDFLKYLSSVDAMQKMYELQVKKRILFGEPYARVEIANTLKDNPYIAPIVNMAPSMRSSYLASRTYDGDAGINTVLVNYLKNAVNSLASGVSPETAIKTFEDGLQQVIKNYNIPTPAL